MNRKYYDMKERLMACSMPEPMSGCWIWLLYCCQFGHGRLTSPTRKGYLAHRCSYETFVGPVAEGNIVRHKCDNPSCINPDHLVQGTNRDNVDDMMRRGRHKAVHNYGKSGFLNEHTVRAIFYDERPIKQVLEHYGISYSHLRRIRNGQAWPHLKLKEMASTTPSLLLFLSFFPMVAAFTQLAVGLGG